MAPPHPPVDFEVAESTTNNSSGSTMEEHHDPQSPVQHAVDANNNDSERDMIFHDLANYVPEDFDGGYSAEDEADEMIGLCEHEEVLGACEDCEIAAGGFCKHGEIRDGCEECEEDALDELCQHGEDRLDCDACVELRHAELGLCRHDMFIEECGDCEMELLETEERALDECPHGYLREDCDECFEDSICEHDEVRAACEVCMDEEDEAREFEELEAREVEEAWVSEDDFSDPDVPTSTAKMWERDLWRQIRRQARMYRMAKPSGETRKSRDADKKRSSRKRVRFSSGEESEPEVLLKNSKTSDDSSE